MRTPSTRPRHSAAFHCKRCRHGRRPTIRPSRHRPSHSSSRSNARANPRRGRALGYRATRTPAGRTCTSLGLLLLEIRSARRRAHELVMRRRASHFPPVPPRCRARAGRATRSGSVREGRWPAAGACALRRSERPAAASPGRGVGGTSHAGQGCNGSRPGPACREAAAPDDRPPWMKLRPCQGPDWRVTGARPAKLATALASRRPSSGIWVSRPAAVMLDTPGIEVRISVRRASTTSSANRLPISASMAARCRSIWDSRVLLCCLSSRSRRCFWRFRAAVRSWTSASRAICSSRARAA